MHDNIKTLPRPNSFLLVVVFKKMADKRPQIITLALILAAAAVIVIHRALGITTRLVAKTKTH